MNTILEYFNTHPFSKPPHPASGLYNIGIMIAEFPYFLPNIRWFESQGMAGVCHSTDAAVSVSFYGNHKMF